MADANRLRNLGARIKEREASQEEIEEFADIVERTGAPENLLVQATLEENGFRSIAEFARHLREPRANRATEALRGMTLGILLAFVLDRALAEEAS